MKVNPSFAPLMMAAAVVATSGAAFAAKTNKPADDGPYKDYYYVRTDFSSVGNNSGSGIHWTIDNSNCEAPVAGKKYYLGPSVTFNIFSVNFYGTSGHTFPGDELVVAGKISHQPGWSYDLLIPTCTFLPGAVFEWTSQSYITGGDWTIKGTVDKPVILRHSGETADYEQKQNYIGDETAYVRVERPSGDGKVGQKWSIRDSWPDFYGTFEIGEANTLYSTTTFSTPGTLLVNNLSSFEVRGNSGTTSLGGLDLKAGATLKVGDGSKAGTQTVKIEDKLSVAPGATVVAKRAADAPALFDLSAEAYAAGVPDAAAIAGWNLSVDGTRTWQKWLPRPMTAWAEGTDGRMSLVVKARPLVQQIAHANLYAENSMTRGDVASFWENSREPEPGNDYQSIGYNVTISPTTDYWTFPGESFTFSGGSLNVFCRGIAFKTLSLGGGPVCKWRWNEGPAVFTGNLNFHEGQALLYTGGGNTVRIDGPITEVGRGGTTVDFRMYGPYLDDWGEKYKYYARAFRADLELRGDNRAYAGTMSFTTLPATDSDVIKHFADWGREPFAPGPTSNLTVRVFNNTNLVSGAMVFNNQSRLELGASATFDYPTKRIEFAGANNYLRAPAGVSATLVQKITYGSGTVVTKEGAGVVYLGGTPTAAGDQPTVFVKEGYLGLVDETAASALKVSVGEKGGLAVKANGEPICLDPDAIAEFEYDESGETPQLAIAVDLADEDIYAGEYTVKLLTFSATSGWTMRFADPDAIALKAVNGPKGYAFGVPTQVVDESTGKATLQVRMFRRPSAFTVK